MNLKTVDDLQRTAREVGTPGPATIVACPSTSGMAFSLAALVWTVFVWLSVAGIRIRFGGRAMLPELSVDLEEVMSAISKELGEWQDNSAKFRYAIARSKPALESIKSFLPRNKQRAVKALLCKIDWYLSGKKFFLRKAGQGQSEADEIYELFIESVQTIKIYLKEMNWQ